MTAASLALAGLLLASAQAEPGRLFSLNETPVRDLDLTLLTEKGYQFDSEGRLLRPQTSSPVLADDYFYLIEELRSGARLTALMRINLIFNRSNFTPDLPEEDKNELREIGRKKWKLLSKSMRDQLTPFFSDKEAFELNAGLAETAGPAPPNDSRILAPSAVPRGVAFPRDRPLDTLAGPLMPLSSRISPTVVKVATAEPAAARAAAASRPAPASGTESPPPLPTEEELDQADSAPAEAPPPAPPAPPPASPAPPPAAAPSAPAVAPPSAADAPQHSMTETFKTESAVPPPVTTTTAYSDLAQEVLKPTVSAELPPPAAASPAPPLPLPFSPPDGTAPATGPADDLEPEDEPPAATSQAEPAPAPAFDAEKFTAFLQTAQYAPRVKQLLELIARHAAAEDRAAALGELMRSSPGIIIDENLSGAGDWYQKTAPDSGGAWQIALNDGVRELTRRRLMRGRETYRLPAAAGVYERLGVPPPDLNSWPKKARSDEQLAGALLHALISAAGAANRATLAEFQFYSLLRINTGKDPALETARAAQFYEWKSRSEDFRDFLTQAAAGTPDGARTILHQAGILAAAPARRDGGAAPAKHVYFQPPGRSFSADIPAGWDTVEEKTPRSISVHILGPDEAAGAWRAAYHVHFYEKDFQDYLPARDFLKRLHDREGPAKQEATPLRSLRVSGRAARIFEVRESRLLPHGRLPAATVTLHHYYAFIPASSDAYAVVKLSTTEETFLEYRKEYMRFLKSFRFGY
ncbi:MAG: hypothetical protein ABIJ96_00130 [Elusimicrobiota bacterium]